MCLIVSDLAGGEHNAGRAGDEVEEPFSTSDNDLTLDALCRTIEIDLLTAVSHPAPLPPLEPVMYILM